MRIRKFLGYGLNNVRYDRDTWRFQDARINSESFLFTHRNIPKLDEYLAWLETESIEGKYSIERIILQEKPETKISGALAFQPEFGLPNVLNIRPVSYPDWERYDDMIDYVEAAMIEQEYEPTAQMVEGGLYPWNGLYMDSRLGMRLDQMVMMWQRARRNAKADQMQSLDLIARAIGYKNHNEAMIFIQPEIPAPIVDLCRFAKVFTDDIHILELRPMLYTYWA